MLDGEEMAFLIGLRPRLVAILAVAARWVPVLLLAAATTAHAIDSGGPLPEQQVKAAFLYKFAGYVEWPAHVFARPEAPLVVGVMGAEALADELEHMVAGRRAGDRPVTTRRLDQADSTAGLHILFMGRSLSRGAIAELLTQLRERPVLTVTEMDQGWLGRSVINFIIEDDKVRFQISVAAAEAAGLRLGSQLLAVAREVRRTPP